MAEKPLTGPGSDNWHKSNHTVWDQAVQRINDAWRELYNRSVYERTGLSAHENIKRLGVDKILSYDPVESVTLGIFLDGKEIRRYSDTGEALAYANALEDLLR